MEISYPLSRETRDEINERIRELTAKLNRPDDIYKYDRLTSDELMWIKELRKLRRIRNDNDA